MALRLIRYLFVILSRVDQILHQRTDGFPLQPDKYEQSPEKALCGFGSQEVFFARPFYKSKLVLQVYTSCCGLIFITELEVIQHKMRMKYQSGPSI